MEGSKNVSGKTTFHVTPRPTLFTLNHLLQHLTGLIEALREVPALPATVGWDKTKQNKTRSKISGLDRHYQHQIISVKQFRRHNILSTVSSDVPHSL